MTAYRFTIIVKVVRLNVNPWKHIIWMSSTMTENVPFKEQLFFSDSSKRQNYNNNKKK